MTMWYSSEPVQRWKIGNLPGSQQLSGGSSQSASVVKQTGVSQNLWLCTSPACSLCTWVSSCCSAVLDDLKSVPGQRVQVQCPFSLWEKNSGCKNDGTMLRTPGSKLILWMCGEPARVLWICSKRLSSSGTEQSGQLDVEYVNRKWEMQMREKS